MVLAYNVEKAYLDLDIEHGVCRNLHSQVLLDPMRKSLLVSVFDNAPFLLELGIIGVLKETLKLGEIFEPDIARDVECIGDEFAEAGVALFVSRRVRSTNIRE